MKKRTDSPAGRRLKTLLLGACIAVHAWPAHAQLSAALSGKVEDATGAAVGDAKVTVTSLETGAMRVVSTNASGGFLVLSLPLGQQEVKVEKTGFRAAIRSGIHLAVGQEGVVRLRLEIGELLQTVTITEEIPVVNTSTSSVSGLVGEREVKDLPLNGRSFDNLITLNPGAINYALKSPQTTTSNGNTFSVSGRRPMDNIFLLNGIEYAGSSQLAVTPGGVSGGMLGIDAVREFNVLTEAYSAEYGKRAGAQVSVVTQSGSNAFHGSMFEFLRNSALDARNVFDQATVPPFKRNQFGGSAGGPLKKNRLFAFGNYEGYRQRLAVSSVSVVPDAQARQGLLPNASGVYTPVAGLNQAMLPFMAMWPEPNGPQLLSNGLPTGTARSFNTPRQLAREDFGTLKVDYNMRERDSLSASYTVDDGENLSPLADPLFASFVKLRSHVLSLQQTHIFSSRSINTFRAGLSRAGFNFDSFPLAPLPSGISFVSGAPPGGIVIGGGVTTTGVAAITAAGPGNNAGVYNRRSLFTYSDNLQLSRGAHQLSMGAWFQRMRDNENTASRQLGQASFASLQTFLQGTVTTFMVVPNPTALGWRSLFGAWYFQDTMKLRPNLTLTAGLRHEFTTGWSEVYGRAANFIPDSQGILQTATRVANSVFTENNAKRMFGPRVSLAWDPFGNGKTAVRAGFGIYHTVIDSLSFHLNSLPPFNGTVALTGSLPALLPIRAGIPEPPACGPNVPAPCTTYAPQGIQADAKTPTVNEWNFTVEQQLSHNTALRLAYVGSFGYHGLLSIDPNSIPAQICANAAGCASGGILAVAARGSVPQGAEYIPVASRPNPYLSGGFFWHTEGNSSYNALQVGLTRRFSQGWQLRGSYTWSKNLDMNSALTIAQSNNQPQLILNRNDVGRDWGLSALNATHQASISGRYELPFGKGKAWLGAAGGFADKLAGGWQLNGIVTLLSGFPFTPQVGASRSGDGNTRNPDRPNVNPSFSGPVVLGKPSQWFNPNAFLLPGPGTYGNLGRSVYEGPGLASVDLSLLKNTTLTERVSLQFRAESFNLFNRPNYGTPNATVFSGTAVNGSAGLITGLVTTSRQIQLGMKLIF